MIKGLRVNSETEEEEVKNLMGDIEAQVREEGVKRIGGMKEGRKGMFLAMLESEENSF